MKTTTLALALALGAGFGSAAFAEQDLLITPEDHYRHQADRRGYSGTPNPAVPLEQINRNGWGNNGYYGNNRALGSVLGGAPFYQDRTVINDWRAYGLERPPRGQRWVRIGNQFVLQRR